MDLIVIRAISAMPAALVCLIALEQTLTYKHAYALLGGQIVCFFCVVLFYYEMHILLRFVCLISLFIIIPYVAAKDSPTYRMLVITSVYVGMMAGEFCGMSVLRITEGSFLVDTNALNVVDDVGYWIARFVQISTTSVFMYAITARLNRVLVGDDNEAAYLCVALVVVQIALMLILWYVIYSNPGIEMSIGVVASILGVVCVITNIYFAYLITTYSQIRRDKARIAMLEDQLETYLYQYSLIVKTIEDIAVIRHDMRGQLEVVYALVDRGHIEKAEEILDAMISFGDHLNIDEMHDERLDESDHAESMGNKTAARLSATTGQYEEARYVEAAFDHSPTHSKVAP